MVIRGNICKLLKTLMRSSPFGFLRIHGGRVGGNNTLSIQTGKPTNPGAKKTLVWEAASRNNETPNRHPIDTQATSRKHIQNDKPNFQSDPPHLHCNRRTPSLLHRRPCNIHFSCFLEYSPDFPNLFYGNARTSLPQPPALDQQ